MKELKFKGRKRGGLPGKSYLQIMEMDFYLNIFLSSIKKDYLDLYVISNLTFRYRNKDRLSQVKDFFIFSSIENENRITILLKSNFISRSLLIAFLNDAYKCAFSNDEEEQKKFSKYFRSKKLVRICKENIDRIQQIFIDHYLSFSIGKLMVNRRGENNPNNLSSDAYFAIMTTINKYNYYRSKVPFHRLLELFLKNTKNKIIIQETWNLPENSLETIDKLQEEELHEKIEAMKSEKLIEVDKLVDNLPEEFRKIITVKYSLFNPLTIDEQKILKNNRCEI